MENKDLGLLIMRITSGLFFTVFGAMKLMGLSGFAEMYLGFFGSAATFVALLVALGEIAGGLSLLSGYNTKIGSSILALIVLGSIPLAHNLFIDPSQMMAGMIRIVLVGYYIGLALVLPNKCLLKKMLNKN